MKTCYVCNATGSVFHVRYHAYLCAKCVESCNIISDFQKVISVACKIADKESEAIHELARINPESIDQPMDI